MKNFCIIFLTLFIISVTTLGLSGVWSSGEALENAEYLRIHIRADSNDERAQAVKYLVKDEVVDYLTPVVAECQTKVEAMAALKNRLSEIAAVADKTLQKNGFSYTATAELKRESFPTRVYGEYVLPAGEYSALILYLGEGKGDNWWCVVYPPLCFSKGNGNIIYKSKIKEIIDRFYQKG